MRMALLCSVVPEDTELVVSVKTNNVAGVLRLNMEQ